MQFHKKTSIGRSGNFFMILIKIILVFLAAFAVIFFLNKIDFPSPYKDIEKNIPNENLKIVK